MSIFLGIDIGGTAARWVAVDDAGATIARGSAPGATGHLFAEAERRRFEATIQTIALAFPQRPVAGIHAGITGLGAPAHGDVGAVLGPAFGTPADAIALSDDIELAFRTAFAPGEGHLVSAGTGSVGVHLTADGRTVRVGGRGILIDDGGSGSWIALSALNGLFRVVDDTGSTDRAKGLADALFAAIGGNDWDDVRAFVYGVDRGRIGTLAPAVAAAARGGDPLARSIIENAAIELARLGKALVRRGGMLPVGFVGGVLDLDPTIPAGITAALPEFDVQFPKLDAALGAAQLARQTAMQA